MKKNLGSSIFQEEHDLKEEGNEDTYQVLIDVLEKDMGENTAVHRVGRSHWLGKGKHDNNAQDPLSNFVDIMFGIGFLASTSKEIYNINLIRLQALGK